MEAILTTVSIFKRRNMGLLEHRNGTKKVEVGILPTQMFGWGKLPCSSERTQIRDLFQISGGAKEKNLIRKRKIERRLE